jgi:hypothetical protein
MCLFASICVWEGWNGFFGRGIERKGGVWISEEREGEEKAGKTKQGGG